MEKLEEKRTRHKREIFQIVEKGIWGTKCATIPTFRTKEYFITKDEHKMYRCLEEIYKDTKNIKISVQVALNQIIVGNTRRYYTKNPMDNVMEKFKGLSIDFVLFDIHLNKIICCIELNGTEHNTDPERKERDEFLRETFSFLNIPLIMIKSQNTYKQTDIKNTIDIEIQKKMTELETTKHTD